MRVRIEFDSRRRRIAYRCGVAVAVALVVCIPVAYASQVGVLNTFSPGQVISSSGLNANFTALKVAINDTDNKCGDLTTLATTAKTSLVAAVNEVNGKIPTGTVLTSVTTDATLTGAGTAASALSVNFTAGETTYDTRYLNKVTGGTVPGPVLFTGPVSVENSQLAASSLFCQGGTGSTVNQGGQGLVAVGGNGSASGTLSAETGGDGTDSTGGTGGTDSGVGPGVGGIGLFVKGGTGGTSTLAAAGGQGGVGIFVQGGPGGPGTGAQGLPGLAGVFSGDVAIHSVTTPITAGGNLTVDGNLSAANGTAQLGNLTVTGNVTCGTATGTIELGASSGSTATITINGNTTVTGTSQSRAARSRSTTPTTRRTSSSATRSSSRPT
jgi:hypothetical protein